MGDRFGMRQTPGRMPTGLQPLIDGAFGIAGGGQMMCQEFGLALDEIGEARLQRGRDAGVQFLSAPAQQGRILPHGGNLFQNKVPAGFAVGNGFGKFAGATQVEELGEIETPIVLTNTLSVAEGRRHREVASEGSAAQNRGLTNRNRISGILGRTSGRLTAKSQSINGQGCRSGRGAGKAIELTWGGLCHVPISELRAAARQTG
jgi:hypothetical protein